MFTLFAAFSVSLSMAGLSVPDMKAGDVQPPLKKVAKTQPTPPVDVESDTARKNPFKPASKMKEALNSGTTPTESNAPAAMPSLPVMRMKGFVKMKGAKPAIALLEVEGDRTHTVRAGDILDVPVKAVGTPKHGATTIALEIVSVSAAGIEVKAEELGKTRVVR